MCRDTISTNEQILRLKLHHVIMPPVREIALFLHLLGVLLLVSGVTVAAVGQGAARGQQQLEPLVALLRLARVGVLLVASGALLVLGAGAWLVGISDRSLSEGWLGAAVIVFLVSMALGAAGGQRAKRARILAASAGGAIPQDVRMLLSHPVSRALNDAAVLGLLVVLALMVFKP